MAADHNSDPRSAAVAVVDVAVIDEPAIASSILDPVRAEILAALSEPGSATSVAAALGLPRQKVNYHLRALEANGLVHLVEERQRRGLVERVMIASARSYLVSPSVLGSNGPDPATTNRLSSRYLIAVAARMVREVAELAKRAEASNKRLATLTIDSEIRFGSPAAQAEFTQELTAAVTDLAGRYHDETAPEGRWHRLVVAAHAKPPNQPPAAERSTEEPALDK